MEKKKKEESEDPILVCISGIYILHVCVCLSIHTCVWMCVCVSAMSTNSLISICLNV